MYFILLLILIPHCLGEQLCEIEMSRAKVLCVTNKEGHFFPIERKLEEVKYEISMQDCLNLGQESLFTFVDGEWRFTSKEAQLEFVRKGKSIGSNKCIPSGLIEVNGHSYTKKVEVVKMKLKLISKESMEHEVKVDSKKENISDYISVDVCLISFCTVLLLLAIVISVRSIQILN